jgi:hypothetical protein
MSERRLAERKRVLLSIRIAGRARPSRITNVSPRGALVAGLSATPGEVLEFSTPKLDFAGRVVWISGGMCGVAFIEPIDVETLLRPSSMFVPMTRSQLLRSKRPGLRSSPIKGTELAILERHGIRVAEAESPPKS